MAKNWGAINRRRRRNGITRARAEAAEATRQRAPQYPRLGGVKLGENGLLSNVQIEGFGDAVTTDGNVKVNGSRLVNNRRGIVAGGNANVEVTDTVIE